MRLSGSQEETQALGACPDLQLFAFAKHGDLVSLAATASAPNLPSPGAGRDFECDIPVSVSGLRVSCSSGDGKVWRRSRSAPKRPRFAVLGEANS